MTDPRPTPWIRIDPRLTMATLAPSPYHRDKALRRLERTTGISRRSLRNRLRYLGLTIDSKAGPRALAKYEKTFRLSLEGNKLFPQLLSKLNTQFARMEAERRQEMARAIPMSEAARILGIHPDTLKSWIRWFLIMEPDREGQVTPKQLLDFLKSDWKWLLPMTKLPNAFLR